MTATGLVVGLRVVARETLVRTSPGPDVGIGGQSTACAPRPSVPMATVGLPADCAAPLNPHSANRPIARLSVCVSHVHARASLACRTQMFRVGYRI